MRGTPTFGPAAILVHLAARPSDVRSWGAVLEALPALYELTKAREVEEELANRPAAVKTRLAYLAHGIDPDLASGLAQENHGKVWFGPRGPLKRHNSTFGVADTILPISPGTLQPLSGT